MRFAGTEQFTGYDPVILEQTHEMPVQIVLANAKDQLNDLIRTNFYDDAPTWAISQKDFFYDLFDLRDIHLLNLSTPNPNEELQLDPDQVFLNLQRLIRDVRESPEKIKELIWRRIY